MSRSFVVLLTVVILVLTGSPAAGSAGDAQLACAFSAALAQSTTNVNTLYQTWFSSAPPSWLSACTTTWASCDCAWGATPTGTLARIFTQQYIVIGANISPPRTVTIGAAGNNPGGTATGYYPDLATALFAKIATHYGKTAPTIYWQNYPFSSPFNNNLQYWLNQNTVDMSMGNAVINGTFVIDANGGTAPRASLVQFPACPYNADSDSIIQGKIRALPGGAPNPLTVPFLMTAAASSVIVCGQIGTTYSTQFVSRGFMATLVTQPNLADCFTLVSNGTAHAMYTTYSSAQSAAAADTASFYAPIAVAGSVFNAFPFFRLDTTAAQLCGTASSISGAAMALAMAVIAAFSAILC